MYEEARSEFSFSFMRDGFRDLGDRRANDDGLNSSPTQFRVTSAMCEAVKASIINTGEASNR